MVWRDIQPQLGQTTRTCAYDRTGLGHSLAMRGVHDARDEIADPADRLLAEHTVGAIAAAVGYRSEYSFSCAFTRHRGIAPGRYRRHARARALAAA
jgi:AraC-like DNA-binding protein